MPEPAVFIVVAVLAVACAAVPFLYWHIKSRRHRASPDDSSPDPVMRRLEAGSLDKGPPPRIPGAAGLVGLQPGGRGAVEEVVLPGVGVGGRRHGSAGSGGSGMSGSTYVNEGEGEGSSSRPSTSTRPYPYSSPTISPTVSTSASTSSPSPHQPSPPAATQPAPATRAPRAAHPSEGRARPASPELPPAYDEVVDERQGRG